MTLKSWLSGHHIPHPGHVLQHSFSPSWFEFSFECVFSGHLRYIVEHGDKSRSPPPKSRSISQVSPRAENEKKVSILKSHYQLSNFTLTLQSSPISDWNVDGRTTTEMKDNKSINAESLHTARVERNWQRYLIAGLEFLEDWECEQWLDGPLRLLDEDLQRFRLC